jgi:hypothetical protein
MAARPALGTTQPPADLELGVLTPGVCETDHSPPSSAKIKNGGAIPLLPQLSSWNDV